VADQLGLGQQRVRLGEPVALALSDMGETSSSFSQKPPLQPPATKALPRKANTRADNSFIWKNS